MTFNDDLLLGVVLLLECSQSILALAEISRQDRARVGNRILERRSFEASIRNMNDFEFRRTFRMHRSAFRVLCTVLEHKLMRNSEMGMRSSAGVISVPVQVAIFLRTLAGARYLDFMSLYGVTRPTVYAVLQRVCDAVLCELALPGLPSTQSTCKLSAS